MTKLRMKFIKEAQASYISHLDLMRTFQRAFLRGGYVVRHSQGFHPHPLMSILLPLPVGQSSEYELMDFETVGETDAKAFADAVNGAVPLGIRVLECYENGRPVRELKYLRARVEFEYDQGVPANAEEELEELFARESLIVEKRTKHKALAEVDIRPMIRKLRFRKEENLLIIDATVLAQDPGLNPGLLASAVKRELPDFAPDFVRVRRLQLMDADGKNFR